MKNLAVFTSGGDAPGMNACIRAVYRTAKHYGSKVFGVLQGYEGLIDGKLIELNDESVYGISKRGGTILQSARSDRFRTKEGRASAYASIKKLDIDAIVAIGGDGTFTGANIFMEEYPDINMVGCPGTIDNDLVGTDFTIGYDTAINTAMDALDKIRDTADSHNRLFFVEVMGRDAGLIALRSGIAAEADAILIPEISTDAQNLIKVLENRKASNQKSFVVVVAEGDDSGGALEIANTVKKALPNFDTKITILGHTQRGGTPTTMERYRAAWMGTEAVQALQQNKKGIMIGIQNHLIKHTSFSDAIKHTDSLVPRISNMLQLLSVVS